MRAVFGAVRRPREAVREWREARGEGKRGQRMVTGPPRGGINPPGTR